MDNRCRIYYCGNPDSNYFYLKIFFSKSDPVISHPGTWMNPRIRDLDCPVQPSDTAGCQGIYRNNKIRLCFCHYTHYNFWSFHSCLSHNARRKTTDPVQNFLFCTFQSIFSDNMTGHPEIIHNVGTQGIRCNCLISQTYHKNWCLPLQIDKLSQMTGDLFWDFSVIILVRGRKIWRFYGNIISLRPPHSLCSVFCCYFYNSSADISFFIILFLYFYSPKLCIALGKALRCFKSQVGSDSAASWHFSLHACKWYCQCLFPAIHAILSDFIQLMRSFSRDIWNKFQCYTAHKAVDSSFSIRFTFLWELCIDIPEYVY